MKNLKSLHLPAAKYVVQVKADKFICTITMESRRQLGAIGTKLLDQIRTVIFATNDGSHGNRRRKRLQGPQLRFQWMTITSTVNKKGNTRYLFGSSDCLSLNGYKSGQAALQHITQQAIAQMQKP